MLPTTAKYRTKSVAHPISSLDIKWRTEDCLLHAENHLVAHCAVPLFAQRSCHVYQDNQRTVFRSNCSLALPLTSFPCQLRVTPGLHHERTTLHVISLHPFVITRISLQLLHSWPLDKYFEDLFLWKHIWAQCEFIIDKTDNNSSGPEQAQKPTM